MHFNISLWKKMWIIWFLGIPVLVYFTPTHLLNNNVGTAWWAVFAIIWAAGYYGNRKILMRAICFFRTKYKPIELFNKYGVRIYSIATIENEKIIAPANYIRNDYYLILKEDGSISKDNDTYGIVRWEPMLKDEKIFFNFQHKY